jgi:Fic family protein
MSNKNIRYSQIHQFEPLLPKTRVDQLHLQTGEIFDKALRLGSGVHPSTLALIKELVRCMNSYYSNRIEGQSTHPINIQRALAQDYSDKPDTAKLQRIAIAYIEAEKDLEINYFSNRNDLLCSSTLIRSHHALYSRLKEDDRTTADRRVIQPGALRGENVTVGRHDPPESSSVRNFLTRMDEVYLSSVESKQFLVHVACAHHRSMWVHPFLDGNGRAVRLQTHLAMLPLTKGLWSMNRGLARNRDAYYANLSEADQPRHGDLDGRGNLSEKKLHQWCEWFIGVASDQIHFMERMLDLEKMKANIEALVTFRAGHDKKIRRELTLPLYHLYLAGPTKRGDFLQMTGLGERTARGLLSNLLETGLVTSPNHKAPVQFAFPLDSLQFIFPNLFPEAGVLND